MTFESIMNSGVAPPNFDWDKLNGFKWYRLLSIYPRFSKYCDWSKLGEYEWSHLLNAQPELEKYFDWSKLKNTKGSYLLMHQPQFAKYCDWTAFNGFDWSSLLIKQPQFSKYCNWTLLNGLDWVHLLFSQPQFLEFCRDYVFEFYCGRLNRIIWISKRDPDIIHIGCFRGTKDEAVEAVRIKYSEEGADKYIAKINSCFEKVNKLCSG